MEQDTWKTAITKVEPNKLLLRGYRIDELIGSISFSKGIFLALRGDLPDDREARLMDALLVSSIDHGVTPPSCLTARTIASSGAPLNAAVAGGVLSISRHHGGAIEDSMRLFQQAVEGKRERGETSEKAACAIIEAYRENKRRLPGFGHRFHSKDPRAVRLFQIADELGIAAEYMEMARAFEEGIEVNLGKKLPINVDGAIAALLCGMGFPPELANAFFIIARVPGLVANVYEENTRMRPMRHINSKDHVYDGPEERPLA